MFENVEEARRFIVALRERLIAIEEYWNGNYNEMAMRDAAIVMRERARATIAMIDTHMTLEK